MIEHGDVGSDRGRMLVRHVHGASAKLDGLGVVDEAGDEHHARRDILGAVGRVLADISFDKAELVSQQERLTILAQGLPPVLVQRMDRHGEKAEFHGVSAARPDAVLARKLAALALTAELI